ncbi:MULTISPECIES: hypothetical protein [Glaesserella]|uniref:DUF5067 domain-containing protein n=1 Tax=Glaesserella australis TaxID=2094024 RepID=A0A328BZG3_9PAST|nr:MULTISPECIES: hypothetical protein [Glaesserella]AUI67040.1 hypothetical protein CJD39_10910 [Glaesserella sp. 15-184]RAL18867.1 hypothetical protein C5N92_05740 [Glaesserella australis]
MKLIKSLIAFSLTALLALVAHAETTKIAPKVEEKSVQKNAAQTKLDQNLKRFSDAITVKFLGINVTKDDKNQAILNFKYSVENKSKRNIRTVHWASNYMVGDKVILVQDMPVSFKNNLKRGTTSELVFSVPFNNLPKETQAILSQPQVAISANYQARSIVFSNGSKIIVQ